MNLTTGEGTTSGWNAALQSIPSAAAQLAIENAYRSIGRPFSRPQHWDDPIAVPWRPGATTVPAVRVTDAAPRRDNTCRVLDVLDRHGNRILPTRLRDGLLPPPSSGTRRTRDQDPDVRELLEFLARKFLRPSSTKVHPAAAIIEPAIDHETDLQQDDIPARSYRDVWGRPENQSARHLRAADERTKAMDSRSLSFHDQLRLQSLLSGPCAFGEDR